jgi:PadR family transcriptional regulator, regulatory protein PadR
MTERAFFALTVPAGGPHGYGLAGEVAELSHGRVRLKTGSLYGVLDRLAAAGLMEPDREETRGGRLRRYCRLTEDGRRALALGRPPTTAVIAGGLRSLRAATARVRARLRRTARRAPG